MPNDHHRTPSAPPLAVTELHRTARHSIKYRTTVSGTTLAEPIGGMTPGPIRPPHLRGIGPLAWRYRPIRERNRPAIRGSDEVSSDHGSACTSDQPRPTACRSAWSSNLQQNAFCYQPLVAAICSTAVRSFGRSAACRARQRGSTGGAGRGDRGRDAIATDRARRPARLTPRPARCYYSLCRERDASSRTKTWAMNGSSRPHAASRTPWCESGTAGRTRPGSAAANPIGGVAVAG